MLDLKRVLASAPHDPVTEGLRPLWTPWGERLASEVDAAHMQTDDAVGQSQPGDAADSWRPHPQPQPQRPHPQQPQQPQHPQPQFARESFTVLDGWWDYAVIPAGEAATSWSFATQPHEWDGRIRVPFSPEAPLSGVGQQLQPGELLWYRRMLTAPALDDSHRCILHFEAVDYACVCYCNGQLVGTHVGGYLPFSFDITDALLSTCGNELVLCVFDPSDAGVQPRGKQRLERGGIWYTAQSGIWQTVWLEVVPCAHIAALAIDAQPDAGKLVLTVTLDDAVVGNDADSEPAPNQLSSPETPRLVAHLLDGGCEVGAASSPTAGSDSDATAGSGSCTTAGSDDSPTAGSGSGAAASSANSPIARRIATLSIDVASPHLWSPDDPHLYQLELTYGDDRVSSYCAFRTVSVEADEQGTVRFFLNHRPFFLRGVLDQGYWPDGLMTAPADDALVFDIQSCKNLGFNMLRKHIKVENDRWYYHCDRLGMLVWQDMVSGGDAPDTWNSSYKPTFFRSSWGRYSDEVDRHRRGLASTSDAFRAEWTATCEGTVRHLANHPSIVTWVLFNEAWGQFDARKATARVRALDPTRPIDSTSGWYDQRCGDFASVHNYFRPLEVYRHASTPPRAFVISEFGGVSCHLPAHSSLSTSYGYATCHDLAAYRTAVSQILATADALEGEGLAGFVYTQLSDVEEETNGLLTYDRRVNKLRDQDSQQAGQRPGQQAEELPHQHRGESETA